MKTGAIEESARILRRNFDDSFAVAPPVERPRVEDFLTIRVGGDPYAVALGDIAGLYRDWRVVAVPSDAPELLGVAGNRGAIVPVYDLGALLGYPPEHAVPWIVTVRTPLVALAFAQFERHVQVPSQAVSVREGASHVRGTVTVEGAPRPIIHTTAVVDVIARRGHRPAKEP